MIYTHRTIHNIVRTDNAHTFPLGTKNQTLWTAMENWKAHSIYSLGWRTWKLSEKARNWLHLQLVFQNVLLKLWISWKTSRYLRSVPYQRYSRKSKKMQMKDIWYVIVLRNSESDRNMSKSWTSFSGFSWSVFLEGFLSTNPLYDSIEISENPKQSSFDLSFFKSVELVCWTRSAPDL